MGLEGELGGDESLAFDFSGDLGLAGGFAQIVALLRGSLASHEICFAIHPNGDFAILDTLHLELALGAAGFYGLQLGLAGRFDGQDAMIVTALAVVMTAVIVAVVGGFWGSLLLDRKASVGGIKPGDHQRSSEHEAICHGVSMGKGVKHRTRKALCLVWEGG